MIKTIDGKRFLDVKVGDDGTPKFEEIEEKAFSWLEENELSYKIWNNKYRYQGESFDEHCNRVTGGDEYMKQLYIQHKFSYGGRTLSNRGTNRGSISNCYSLGFIPDSLDGILEYGKDMGLTYKSQGGQGASLSHIRPKGTMIGKDYESDGIIPFMEIFNSITNSVSQGGSRKGALLMSMDVWHKQIDDFITIKSKEGKIEKANLSVEIDDEFMKYIEQYRETGENPVVHIERDYNGHKVEYDVKPVEVFKKICQFAKDTAEPGIIFTNRFRNYNIMEYCDDYQIETCNPCGEQPLPKHGSCLLSSINLAEYVIDPYTENARFDYDSLKMDLSHIVPEMDKLSSESRDKHPLKEQRELCANYRNMGIGYMGWADMLVQMNIVYGSKEHLKIAHDISNFVFRNALLESVKCGINLGSFPNYTKNVWDASILKNNFTQEEIQDLKKADTLRNCALLSIAPTGSIATMFNVSGGVEPYFALSYKRKTVSLEGNESLNDVYVREVEKYHKLFPGKELPNTFVTAYDINYLDRIKVQGVLQDCVDTAISSTINLPKTTTIEDIEDLYYQSWKYGLKGVTIFVDGSRDPILYVAKEDEHKDEIEVSRNDAPKRPKKLPADYYEITVKGVKYIVIVGVMGDHPYEVFAFSPIDNMDKIGNHKGLITKVKKGVYSFTSYKISIGNLSQENTDIEAASTRFISGLLRHGVATKYVIDISKKVSPNINSFLSAICRVLQNYAETNEEVQEKCPNCGAPLVREVGCLHCTNCEYSRCG